MNKESEAWVDKIPPTDKQLVAGLGKDQATKRPWINNPEYEGTLIKSFGTYETICEVELPKIREIGYDGCAAIQEANASLIVKAVNCHDIMVMACKDALRCAVTDNNLILVSILKDAIAKAGEL